jgi:hypothetical protein
MKPIETYYRSLLRQIQHLPTSTAIPAIYLLMGCIPIEGQIHVKMLTFFGRLVRNTDRMEFEIIQRQLAVKDLDSNSWTVQIRKVLHRYELPTAYQILNNPPNKRTWKRMVETAVHHYWFRELTEQAMTKSTLSLLDIATCNPGQLHSVWNHNADPLEAHMATVKARVLVQRYPLYSSYCAGPKKSSLCPLCKSEEETVQHFLLQCTALAEPRLHYLKEIYHHLLTTNTAMPNDRHELTLLIMNPEAYIEEEGVARAETITRRMVFKLHNERTILLGGESEYKRGRGARVRKSK